jgi:peptidoglycan/xylan/chitin deacetylase (PgdA/CDA1 family)
MGKLNHFVKSALGWTEHTFPGIKHQPGELLVLNYHGTQKKFLDRFREQLDYLDKRFTFFSPESLHGYFYENVIPEKACVLLTFDDGIRNNFRAAEILRDRGIRAIFFLIPGFIDTPASDQRAYFLKNIRPQPDFSVDSEEEDLTALSWSEINELLGLGHFIGSHTLTHTLIAIDSSPENSIREIVESKKILEAKTGQKIDSFCGPNNSLLSCGEKEMKLVKENYRYFFSTIPGSNLEKNPLFIRRSNVEAHWLKGAFMQSIGKWDRKRWDEKARQFSAIAR